MSAIVVNGRAAARARVGGVERWARELVARLPELDPDRYAAVVPPERLAYAAGQLWEQAMLPALARRRGAQIVLSPAGMGPLAGRPGVVVVHDAAALRHPEWFSRPYAAWHGWAIPRLMRRAARVITVSEFSRSELAELGGVDPARIEVVHGGVDARFSPHVDPGPARRALGLPGDYVLAVATPSARKRLGGLGEAARALGSEGVELVVAGAGRGYLPGGDDTGAGGLRSLGYVEEELLPGLYAGASALVMPSSYEGFGLPCLEAMASGTPVVASRTGALSELWDGAALLVDPGDGDGFAVALTSAVADAGERERLVAAGLERAAAMTWDATAQAVDAVVGGVLRR